MAKSNLMLKYNDNVIIKNRQNVWHKVYVIRNGAKASTENVIWLKGKKISLSTGLHVVVSATTTNIYDKTTSHANINSSYTLYAGEKVTFNAKIAEGYEQLYELSSPSSAERTLQNLNNLVDSDFNDETITFESQQLTIPTAIINWSIGNGLNVDNTPGLINKGSGFLFKVTASSGYNIVSDNIEITGIATITRLDDATSLKVVEYSITNIRSDITISIPSIAAPVSFLNGLLDDRSVIKANWNNSLIGIDTTSRDKWIIEPIEPIYEDFITFEISPSPIGDDISGYYLLPCGITSPNSNIAAYYEIKLEEGFPAKGYASFKVVGNVGDTSNIGKAEIIVAPGAAKVSISGFATEYMDLQGLDTTTGSIVGDMHNPSGVYYTLNGKNPTIVSNNGANLTLNCFFDNGDNTTYAVMAQGYDLSNSSGSDISTFNQNISSNLTIDLPDNVGVMFYPRPIDNIDTGLIPENYSIKSYFNDAPNDSYNAGLRIDYNIPTGLLESGGFLSNSDDTGITLDFSQAGTMGSGANLNMRIFDISAEKRRCGITKFGFVNIDTPVTFYVVPVEGFIENNSSVTVDLIDIAALLKIPASITIEPNTTTLKYTLMPSDPSWDGYNYSYEFLIYAKCSDLENNEINPETFFFNGGQPVLGTDIVTSSSSILLIQDVTSFNETATGWVGFAIRFALTSQSDEVYELIINELIINN